MRKIAITAHCSIGVHLTGACRMPGGPAKTENITLPPPPTTKSTSRFTQQIHRYFANGFDRPPKFGRCSKRMAVLRLSASNAGTILELFHHFAGAIGGEGRNHPAILRFSGATRASRSPCRSKLYARSSVKTSLPRLFSIRKNYSSILPKSCFHSSQTLPSVCIYGSSYWR